MNVRQSIRPLLAALLFMSMAIAIPLQAAPITWNSAGTAWATGANWVGGVAPANDITTDTAVFNSAAYANQPTVTGARSVAGLQVGSGSTAALTILGTSTPNLTIGSGGILVDATANQLIFNSNLSTITLGASQVWENNAPNALNLNSNNLNLGSHTLTVTGSGGSVWITRLTTGTGAIIKNGSNNITFSNSSNDFSGGLTLNSGTLTINTSNVLGTGLLTLNGGSIRTGDVTGRSLSNPLLISGSVTHILAANSSNSDINFTNSDLAISGNPTITMNNSASRGFTFNNVVKLQSDATFAGTGKMQMTNGIDLQGGSRVLNFTTTGNEVRLGGVLSNSMSAGTSLTLTGTGTVRTSGTISAGTNTPQLVLNGATLLSVSANSIGVPLVINSGTWDMTANQSLPGLQGAGGTVNSSSNVYTITLDGTGSYSYAGAIAPSTTNRIILLKTGTGTQVLSGNNTYTGNTRVEAGTLRFAQLNSLYNGTPANWTPARLTTLSGATLALNVGGGGEFSSSNVQTIAGLGGATTGFLSGSFLGLDTSNAGTFTHASNLVNPNSGTNVLGLRKLGTGTLELTGNNTYTGATRVEGGSLSLNGGTNNSGSFVVSAGADFIQSGTDWTTDLFHSTGAGSTIDVAQLADSSDNDSVIRFNLSAGVGVSTINLSSANPFANITGGLTEWKDDWVVEFNLDNIFTTADFTTLTLFTNTGGGYNLANFAGLYMVTTDGDGNLQPAAPIANNETIFLAKNGNLVGTYKAVYTANSVELVFQSARAIPEPGTFGLLALGVAMLRWKFRKRAIA